MPPNSAAASGDAGAELTEMRLDREVEALLTQRLLDESPLASLPHVGLAIVTAVLVTSAGMPEQAVWWASAVTIAVLLRALLRRRAFWAASGEAALRAMRLGVFLVALAWGGGAILVAPRLPLADLALILVLFSGLIAGATSSLLADMVAFQLFLAATLVPIAVGFARSGETASHLVGVVLIALFAVAMLAFQRRAHLGLREHYRTSTRLGMAEKEATRERVMLETLIGGTPSAILVLRRSGEMIRINPNFERLFGYTVEELSRGTINELIVPIPEQAAAIEAERRVWAGETVVAEVPRRRKDGSILTVRLAAAAVNVGDDLVAFVMFDDVTAAVRAREALKESEQRLFQVLDHMPVGVFVVNAMGEAYFANAAAREFLGKGIAPGAAVGDLAESYNVVIAGTDTFYPEDRLPVVRALAGERSVVDDMEILRPDGRRALEAVGSPIRDSEGRVVYGVAVFSDVTDRRAADRRLKETEKQYRRLVESASDMVWRLDAQGRFTYANAASERIYGLRPEQLLGRAFLEFSDDGFRENDTVVFRDVMSGRDIAAHETVHRDTHGRARHLSTSVHPVWDAFGSQVVAVHGIARDVTDQVAAREAMRAARDAAEKATAAKSSFLANMSHEIRTPMNGVLGMVELLLDTELSPDQRRSAELISSSGEALMMIINDILDFSKIEAGQLDIEAIEFDLPPVVDSAARLQMSRAHQRGLELICDVRPEVPHRVLGDAARIRQVVTNLLGNAIKFTHQGEVEISVRLLEERDGHARLRFAVRDTGIGISADQRALIFEPFKQGDVSTSRRYGGTGLGLSISRRLVELMGGTLEVQGEVGKGSEFSFALNLPVVAGQAAAPTTQGRLSLHSLKALVVDDHPTNRRVTAEMLRWGGCVVEEAPNARQGLEALRQAASSGSPYALLLTDVHMPEQDGFDFAAAVRADAQVSDTPIMILTSGGQRGDGQRCRELGIGAYLLKPVSRSELVEAVVTTLSGQKTRASGMHLVTRHTFRESRRNLRILLAEDNEVNQEVAAAMLRKRGHTVDIVVNGLEALEAARGVKYDVILMDLQMPEMDGLRATAEIRKLTVDRPVPIIAVTANAMSGERERCLAAGMDDYLAKPFKPHDLFSVVEGWGVAQPAAGGSAPAQPPAAPVDVEGLRAELRSAGVEEITGDLIQTFVTDSAVRMAALVEAADSGDAGAIERAAHAYKSAAGTVRANELAQLLKEAERAAKEGETRNAKTMMRRIGEAHEAARAYLVALNGAKTPA